jgi:hypothetical protein
MKARLLWIAGLGLLAAAVVLAATTPLTGTATEATKTGVSSIIQQGISQAPSTDAMVANRIALRQERDDLLAQAVAAKKAGHKPAADLYDRLRRFFPTSGRGAGHLDQGAESCVGATVISALPYSDFGTTAGYQNDYNPDCSGTGGDSPDVVYTYTPTQTGDFHISLCGSSYDTRIFVYEGTCSGEPIACNDDDPNCWPSSSIPAVQMVAGTHYYIVVDGYGDGAFGDYSFSFDAVAAGNVCEDPVVVSSLPYSVVNASTCGFGHDYDGTCAFFAEGPDVVYRFTLATTTSVEVVLNAHPSTGTMPEYVWPTMLLSDHCPPDGNCIAMAWNTFADVLYFSCRSLEAGTYYVVISSETWYHPCFDYDLTIRSCGPCEITSQPGDVAEVAEPWPVPGTFSINDPDGGCGNSAPFTPQYQNITTPQTIYGRTFAYTDSITSSIKADMDWYRVVVTTPVTLTCTYGGESMLRVKLLTPPCPGIVELSGPPATPCYTGTFSQCLEPGEYYVRIERAGDMSVADTAPLEYRATFNMVPCTLPQGRCCYAGTCTNNTHYECDALYGVWTAGLTCNDDCPVIPANDNCHNAGVPAPLPATFTGSNVGANNDCPLYEGDPQVWHVFVNPEMQDIQVDYCGTVGFSSFNPWLYNGCPCAERTMLDLVDWGYCDTTAMTGIWRNLPAGTWYISVTMYNPNSIGSYTLHVNAVSSAPPVNDECTSASPITLVPNGSVTLTGTTLNANISCETYCQEGTGNYQSVGGDVFYSLTLTECRRIAMALGHGDGHLAIYQGLNQCCIDPPFLCNDEDANFTNLPWWDVAEQHPGGQRSYVAASLDAGTYLIRVGKYATQVGAYSLTIFDNGSCHCTPPVANDVTAYREGESVVLRWSTDAASVGAGTYRIYASATEAPPGDPSWAIVADGLTPVLGQHRAYYTAPYSVHDRRFYYVTGLCTDGPSPQLSTTPVQGPDLHKTTGR